MFDWRTFHALAVTLSGQVGNDAALRSAISRSYYSAFCHARNYLVAQGVTVPSTGAAHKTVPQQLGLRGPNEKQVAVLLRRLRARRNKADYEDKYAPAAHVPPSLADCTNAITLIDALP